MSNFFLLNGWKIYIICDASHVLKLIRNMLQNKGIIKIHKAYQEEWNMITNEVRREVIEELVKFQEKFELKIAPKLNAKVLERGGSHFGKMDVGCAMSVFSKDTAATIGKIFFFKFNSKTKSSWYQFAKSTVVFLSDCSICHRPHCIKKNQKSPDSYLSSFQLFFVKKILEQRVYKLPTGNPPNLRYVGGIEKP